MKVMVHPLLPTMLAALLLSLAWDLGYGLLSLESLACLLFALLLGGALNLVSARSARLRMGLLVFVFGCMLDIYFLRLAWLAWLLLGLGMVFALAWPRRVPAPMLVIAALAFAFILRAQVPAPTSDPVVAGTAGPTQLLVHLVLDELGGLDSIPAAHRRANDIEIITRGYAQRGFRVYSGVESLSPDSARSLGMLLDERAPSDPDRNIERLDGKDAFRIRDNHLQADIAQAGWRVSILQSWFVDHCRPEFSCSTYVQEGSNHLLEILGGWKPRLQALGYEFASALISEHRGLVLATSFQPGIFEYLMLRANWRNPTLPLIGLRQFDHLQESLSAATGRNYVFAHLLLPHFPWILRPDCSVKPLAEWRLPYAARYRPEAESRSEAFEAWQDQALCAHHRTFELVDALDRAYPGRVWFILHGDHGPRILLREIPEGGVATLDPETRRNLLSTFVAARLDHIPADSTPDTVLQTLVPALLRAAIRAPGEAPSTALGTRAGQFQLD